MDPIDLEDLANDIQGDVSSPDSLAELEAMMDSLVSTQEKVAELTDQLKRLNQQETLLSQVKIPQHLAQFGLSELKLADGRKVVVKDEYKVKIPIKREEAAYAWLNEHGYGAQIKTKLVMEYGKGDAESCAETMTLLEEKGVDYNATESIHAGTLKKLVRECIETDAPGFQQEDFGVFKFNKTTIK